MPSMEDIKSNNLILGIAFSALIALMTWTAWQTQEQSNQIARMTVYIETLTSNVEKIKLDDVKTELALKESRIKRLEEWVGDLSSRLASVEQDIRKDR